MNGAVLVTVGLIALLVVGEVRSAYRGPGTRRPLWLTVASATLFVVFAVVVASRVSRFR